MLVDASGKTPRASACARRTEVRQLVPGPAEFTQLSDSCDAIVATIWNSLIDWSTFPEQSSKELGGNGWMLCGVRRAYLSFGDGLIAEE